MSAPALDHRPDPVVREGRVVCAGCGRALLRIDAIPVYYRHAPRFQRIRRRR